MYLLSLLLLMILNIFYMLISINGNLAYYFDPSSLLFVFLITIPVLISAGLFRDFNNAFRLSTKRSAVCSHRELERAVEAVGLTIKTLWSSGIFYTVFLLVFSFIRSAEDTETLLPYLGISFLPLLYASFFAILLLPMHSRLKLRLCAFSDQPASLPESDMQDGETK